MSATEEVARLERRRVEAINSQDLDGLRAMLSDDYEHCHATGLVQTADESTAHIARSPRQVAERAPRIRVHGDTAVLTGELVNMLTSASGEPSMLKLWVTQVACRYGDGWRFVSFQATRLGA